MSCRVSQQEFNFFDDAPPFAFNDTAPSATGSKIIPVAVSFTSPSFDPFNTCGDVRPPRHQPIATTAPITAAITSSPFLVKAFSSPVAPASQEPHHVYLRLNDARTDMETVNAPVPNIAVQAKLTKEEQLMIGEQKILTAQTNWLLNRNRSDGNINADSSNPDLVSQVERMIKAQLVWDNVSSSKKH